MSNLDLNKVTLRPMLIFGANTDVGKTHLSCLLAEHWISEGASVCYIKPLQTGLGKDADRVLKSADPSGASRKLRLLTLNAWPEPISPHAIGSQLSDADLIRHTKAVLNAATENLVILEGAGGVASPTPAGTPQSEVYRALFQEVILVGDSNLGGISVTLASASVLKQLGYQIQAIVFSEARNVEYFKKHTKYPTLCFTQAEDFEKLIVTLTHFSAGKPLAGLASRAMDTLWWPFTQHQALQRVTSVESAFGDFIRTSEPGLPLFDGNASWWTQIHGHAHPRLVTALTHAAGRYGHVLYPQHVHLPALQLAEQLIEGTALKGAGAWAQKCFYTDNGSTAVEVALKMAFRYSHGLTPNEHCYVIGLKDSYHGDTLGTLDASSPNVFKETEHWYKPRGVWLDFPTVSIQKSRWVSEYQGNQIFFNTVADVFDDGRLDSEIHLKYQEYISEQFRKCVAIHGQNPSALLIEPLIHGSAGMIFVDPLFQRALVRYAKRMKVPVIFDEVFAGIGRLGVISSTHLLKETPDIACYSKTLTGGMCPLGVTLASDTIFETFLGKDKSSALLHGHSYSAYPVGCAVAVESLSMLQAALPMENIWPQESLSLISEHPQVKRIVALGTVCAIELLDQSVGYTAEKVSATVVEAMRTMGWSLRPLGNVVYLIVSVNTPKSVARSYLNDLYQILKTKLDPR